MPPLLKHPGGNIAIRPEDIILSMEPPGADTENTFRGQVAAFIDRGFFLEIIIRYADFTFTSFVTKGAAIRARL